MSKKQLPPPFYQKILSELVIDAMGIIGAFAILLYLKKQQDDE